MKRAFKYRGNIKQDTFSLLNNEIYVPNLDQLNDPFEDTIIETLQNYSKNKTGLEEVSDLLNRIRNEVGIYSMSLPTNNLSTAYPDNELMWAHYANSHKGFCIEYDIDIIQSDYLVPRTVNNVNVVYKEIDRKLFSSFKDKDIFNALLGIKSPSWKYENETRLIFDTFGIKKYNKAALKAVYFGSLMKQSEREEIIKGLSGVRVDFFEITPIKGDYKLCTSKIGSNDIYVKDRLPDNSYKILSDNLLPKVQNFTVLYKEKDKSNSAIGYFISKFRQEHAIKASNITVIDDIRVEPLLDKEQLTPEETIFISKHWIAYLELQTNLRQKVKLHY